MASRLSRLHAFTRSLLPGALLIASAGAPLTPQFDLAVDLHPREHILLVGSLIYDVSITNAGPAALASATVTVQLDGYAHSTYNNVCAFDAATDRLSCTFGPLASGATATVSPWVMFGAMPGTPAKPTPLPSVATLSASTPSDPYGSNNSDTHLCYYMYVEWSPPYPPPQRMIC